VTDEILQNGDSSVRRPAGQVRALGNTGLDLMQILGHHSKVRKMNSIEPLGMDFRLSARTVAETYGESSVLDLFRQRGYEVDFCP
jgi:hypothetical protein